MIQIKSKIKILKRLNCTLPSLSNKKLKSRKQKKPGEHPYFRVNKTSTKLNYNLKLKEKQRLKFTYVLKEKQLKNYLDLIYKNYKINTNITTNLYNLLELRFDSILFRLGFARTILEARQMINHKHFYVNNKKINIPGFICKVNDTIFTNFKIAKNNFEIKRKITSLPKYFNLLDSEKIIIKLNNNNPIEYIETENKQKIKKRIKYMYTKTFEFY